MSDLTDRLYSRIRHHNDLFGWDFMAKSCRLCHGETAIDGNTPEGWTNVGHAPDCPVPEIEADDCGHPTSHYLRARIEALDMHPLHLDGYGSNGAMGVAVDDVLAILDEAPHDD